MQQRKLALHAELITKYKAFFESKLAITLLNQPEILPAVHEVSKAIINLIQIHKKDVLLQIQKNSKITLELFDTRYFGRLPNTADNPENILNLVLEKLNNAKTDLSEQLQIHAIFTYRIYPELNIVEKVSKQISVDRARKENKEKEIKLSKQLGITNHPVFSKKIGDGPEHLPAVGRFIPDTHSYYYHLCDGLNIPFVAGPSGHTASLIQGALTYGLDDTEKLTQYALAIFVFLTAGGNHSFNEVFFVANKIAHVPFKIDCYGTSFPLSFKQSSCYQKLFKQFPEFLEDTHLNQKQTLY